MLSRLAIVFTFAALSTQAASAQELALERCGFQIKFPSEPLVQLDTVSAGGTTTARWRLTSREGTAVYGVTCQALALPPTAEARDEILSGVPSAFGGRVVEQRPISVGGQPGVEYVVDIGGTVPYFYNRAYVTDRAVLIVTASDFRSERGVELPAFRRFHESFLPTPAR